MKQRSLSIFLIYIFISCSAFAGKYAADFLHIGVGARSAAMGNAYSALANDAAAFYWNPAGLPDAGRLALQFDHVSMFNGLAQYNVANASLSLRHDVAIALGWIRLGVDEIPRYAPLQGTRVERLTTGRFRSTGHNIGYFSDAEDAVLVSIAKKIKFDLGLGRRSNMLVVPIEMSLGLTGKFIHHKLDDKAGTGQGLDAGLLVRTTSRKWDRGEAQSWLGIGLIARDLSRTSITWNTSTNHQDQVETVMLLGLAGSKYFDSFDSRLTLSFDQEITPYNDSHFGVEFAILHTVALRAGIWGNRFSAGTGLSFKGFRIDYAFVMHDLGNTHRVSGVLGL
jgi:hypothetical protein